MITIALWMCINVCSESFVIQAFVGGGGGGGGSGVEWGVMTLR